MVPGPALPPIDPAQTGDTSDRRCRDNEERPDTGEPIASVCHVLGSLKCQEVVSMWGGGSFSRVSESPFLLLDACLTKLRNY